MENADKKCSCRGALLDAGKRLFSERGYDSVSTREIAEEAKANLGAIQYYFGSKERLFLEVIYSLMQGLQHGTEFFQVPAAPSGLADAALRLCMFVQSYLSALSREETKLPCRMMLREVFSPATHAPETFDALFSAVIKDFVRPIDETLLLIVRALRPDLPEKERELHAQSIIGECFFYLSHAPFLKQLRNTDYSRSDERELVAQHIAARALRAFGCEEDQIRRSVNQVFRGSNHV